MTRSSTKELFTPFKELEREFQLSRKLLKTLSLDESRSHEFNLFSDLEEYSKEEVAETMPYKLRLNILEEKSRGGYRAAVPGFFQRNNANPLYQERRQSMEETLNKFRIESTKRRKENYDVLQEIGFGSLPSSTEANPRDHVKSISTTAGVGSNPIWRIGSHQYKDSMAAILQKISIWSCHISNNSIPKRTKDPGVYLLPCYINNVCFDNALADLELATVKYPKGIAENVLVVRRDQVDDLMPTIEEGEMATEIKTWEILFLENHSTKLHAWKQEDFTKYECVGDVVDFKTWIGISIQDHNNEYYGFRWSNLLKLVFDEFLQGFAAALAFQTWSVQSRQSTEYIPRLWGIYGKHVPILTLPVLTLINLQYNTHDIDLLNGITISFRSLKKPVVNITNTSTNKAFQVLVDPSCLQSLFNSRYELFAPCHVPFESEWRYSYRIERLTLNLWTCNQCFRNEYVKVPITELVYYIKPHDLSFIVVNREHYCSRRINDGIIMLEYVACGLSSWFSEVQLRLVAFNAEMPS
ncbi:hypothetical protein Tco_0851660 [Tanacetum coccineum]